MIVSKPSTGALLSSALVIEADKTPVWSCGLLGLVTALPWPGRPSLRLGEASAKSIDDRRTLGRSSSLPARGDKTEGARRMHPQPGCLCAFPLEVLNVLADVEKPVL